MVDERSLKVDALLDIPEPTSCIEEGLPSNKTDKIKRGIRGSSLNLITYPSFSADVITNVHLRVIEAESPVDPTPFYDAARVDCH